MKKNTLAFILALLFIGGCSHHGKSSGKTSSGAAKKLHPTGWPHMETSVSSILWLQNAGEVKALSYQAFQLARLRLDEDLRSGHKGKKRAVVVDIDETVLDNGPYQAWGVVTGEQYPTGWANWVNMGEARALPGAVEFLRYADSKGGERLLHFQSQESAGGDYH